MRAVAAEPEALPPCLSLALVAGFRVDIDNKPVAIPSTAQRVLAFLALRRASDRAYVAGTLWPDCTDDHATASLRSAIWRANQALPGAVESSRHDLRLAASVSVDVDVIDGCADRLQQGCSASDADALMHMQLGEILPGWDEDWLVIDRERIRQVELYTLAALAKAFARENAFHRAIDVTYRALGLEPLRESTHRLLMELHHVQGDDAEALRCFERYRVLVRREIGIDPSPQMAALRSRVLQQRDALVIAQ
jgi:DNA-binding SARP family transcriptional activator